MLKRVLVALAVLTAGASAASATTVSIATAKVNLRAGPSTTYPVVTVVPQGARILMHGCAADYAWCDVAFGNTRGWVSASYLQVAYAGRPVVLTPALAPVVGLTVVDFNRVYWDTYYAAQPWYGSWATYYRPYPLGAPRLNSRSHNATCVDGACAGTRSATGIYGGSTIQTRNCAGGECSATRETTGRYGYSASRIRSCSAGDRTCSMTRTGPFGGTASRTRVVNR
jgi:uncharacterized protein YraI